MQDSDVRVEEIKIEGNYKDILPTVLLSQHVNRTTLAQLIPSDFLFFIDCLVMHLSADFYASFIMTIKRNVKDMDMLSEAIQCHLSELKDLQKRIFFTNKPEKSCH